MHKLTHKQRIQKVLAFEATDRLPYSHWQHNPNRDRHPRRLAELALTDQKHYDLDFIKLTPYGMYETIDFGVELDVFPGYNLAPVLHSPIIKEASDWRKLPSVDGTRGEYLYALEGLRILFEMMGGERIPVQMTIFNTLTTAAKMCSPEMVAKHLREDPESVHIGLENILATKIQFMKACCALGVDGFFVATQMSSYNYLTDAEHDEFVMPYDRLMMEAVENDTWFNTLHIHGKNTMISKLAVDYPTHAINWHDRDDGPTMDEVRKYSDKVFVGGLSWGTKWLDKTEAEVCFEVEDTSKLQDGKGIILGPGCVVDPYTPVERLELLRDRVIATSADRV